jgi:glycosyltransferase involved in cell wall biosynthesis
MHSTLFPRPMNILLITDGLPPLVLGGTGNIVWQTAKGLQKRGHTVATLSASPNPKSRDEGGVLQLEIPERHKRWMHYRSVFSRKRMNEIMHVIEEVQPDVIHAHTIANQIGYAWIPEARRKKIPVIVTMHDVMNAACGRVTGLESSLWLKDLKRARWTWNPLRVPIVRNILNNEARVFTVSNALKSFMERAGFTNLHTLHNGIDTEFWKPQDQAQARTDLGVPQDATIFFLSGRLGYDKGTDLIAKALPQNAHLILAGRIDATTFHAIQDRVHMYEKQNPEGMRNLYAACDAVLVPSKCLDCFPTVCLEGMSCARPILATTWGGSKESVKDKETGWILDPLDTAAWQQHMQWCMEHRSELPEFGARGRKLMETEFGMDKYLFQLLQVYTQAIVGATKANR